MKTRFYNLEETKRERRKEYLSVLKKRWPDIQVRIPTHHPSRKLHYLNLKCRDMEALRRLYDIYEGHVSWWIREDGYTLVITIELKMVDYDK